MTTGYTFYGDLLGIGSYYTLNPKIALEKLNDFYNETFDTLRALQQNDLNCQIEMFSDSLFIIGDDVWEALEGLGDLYSNLLKKDLMLRGGIVSGKLSYQPRLVRENFQKRLPEDDTLARAAGLEKIYKGSRLILEKKLANTLFEEYPSWSTNEGYVASCMNTPEHGEILKRICPTPDNLNYEFLYYWFPAVENREFTYTKEKLSNLSEMTGSEAKIHFTETIELLNRTETKIKFEPASRAYLDNARF